MTDDTKLVQYIEVILVHLGYDTDSPLFKDTAMRFANRMRPFFANPEVPLGSIVAPAVEVNEDLTQTQVSVAPIEFTAMCARHFMPIFGSVGVAYIPNEKQPSIKAITNVVEYHTSQFIDQQTANVNICREIAAGAEPRAIYVVICARHTCEGNAIVTTEYGGNFQLTITQSLVERVERSVR